LFLTRPYKNKLKFKNQNEKFPLQIKARRGKKQKNPLSVFRVYFAQNYESTAIKAKKMS